MPPVKNTKCPNCGSVTEKCQGDDKQYYHCPNCEYNFIYIGKDKWQDYKKEAMGKGLDKLKELIYKNAPGDNNANNKFSWFSKD